MAPRKRRQQRGEAARLTDVLIGEGFSRAQVADILGRNSSIVSRFFTRGPGQGKAYTEALTMVVQEVQAGGPRDVASLKALAGQYVKPRTTKEGKRVRVRRRDVVRAEKTVTVDHERRKVWTSSRAVAGKQHIASGASRLRPVVEEAAANGGKIGFTARCRKRDFIHDAGLLADSPGVRRNVVQRRDGTEERAYGDNVGGPGSGEEGFDAREFKTWVDAAGGDVTAAVRTWLVENGRIHPDAVITHLEIRAWMPREH
ncbi:hypothetical protein ACH4PU_30540 [Streptomyces sp. NPDC021100]|uniref:hypothetical protein n=1 Tax=Streptomyces sp. NPDC021100 TaxID=3365114 RepID=UPI0037B24DEB